MEPLIITPGWLITGGERPQVLRHTSVLVEAGRISSLGSRDEMLAKVTSPRTLDWGDRVLMPGHVLAHTHCYGYLARGLPLHPGAARTFPERLKNLWWRLDRALTPDDIRISALAAAARMLRAGATAVLDHHSSPTAVGGSLGVIAGALGKCGLRAVLAYETSDRDGPKVTKQAISENLRFAEQEADGEWLGACFGLHASFTLSDRTLQQCAEAWGDGRPFHLHLAEGTTDRGQTQARYGYGSPVERLEKLGVLREGTVLAHAIDVRERELAVMGRRGCFLVHNPRSNLNNRVGIARVRNWLAKGVGAAFGTDGFPGGCIEELEVGWLAQQTLGVDGASLEELGAALWSGGRRLARHFLKEAPGLLKPGEPADLVGVRYDPPTPLTTQNLWWHMVLGVARAPVVNVMVGGHTVLEDGRVVVVDEEHVLEEARAAAERLWRKVA